MTHSAHIQAALEAACKFGREQYDARTKWKDYDVSNALWALAETSNNQQPTLNIEATRLVVGGGSSLEGKIKWLLENEGAMTSPEIAEKLNAKVETIRNVTSTLCSIGVIQRKSRGVFEGIAKLDVNRFPAINQLSKGFGLIVAIVLLASAIQCGAQTLFTLPSPVAALAAAVNPNLGSVTLGWAHSASSNVTSYSVQYGTNRAALNNSAGVGYVTNATITGLFPVNTYYFTVTARNAAGVDSEPSNVVTNFIQPRLVMLPDRWKVWLNLPAGRTSIVQSCTNANFVGTIRNILTNSSGGSIWFYATNDAVKNFYRVKP